MTAVVKPPIDIRTLREPGAADGVFYLGRPDWLTADLLAALVDESDEQRAGAKRIRAQHFGQIGPVAQRLRDSRELAEFVVRHSVAAVASGSANYRYYDYAESHMQPHCDTPDYAVHLTIMLSHDADAERRSALLLFPHGPEPLTICMEPGEAIIFHAERVIHARTPVSADGTERAVNLGIGFTPTADLPSAGFWNPSDGWSPEPV